MSNKNKEEYNSYMKEYMLKRYHKRRKEAFDKLGGKCAHCGCIPEAYEFDHIDPETKEFTLSEMWSISNDKFNKELNKCQVLCKACHNTKTITERGQIEVKGKNVHGTLSSVRYCKCELCKAARRIYHKTGKSVKVENLDILKYYRIYD